MNLRCMDMPVRARRFARSEEGGISVEACLWLPFFLFFFFIVINLSMLFSQHAGIQRVVQDGARQYVTGRFGFDATGRNALEAWIEATVSPVAPNVNATATFDATSGLLTTTVTYPATDNLLGGTGSGLFSGLTMRARTVHLTES